MKVLVVDPLGGISGDMLAGALIHTGCPPSVIQDALGGLGLGGWSLEVRPEKVEGIECIRVHFSVEDQIRHRTLTEITKTFLARLAEGPRQWAERIFTSLADAEAAVHAIDRFEVHFHEVGALDSILDICAIAAAIDHLGVERVYTRSVPVGSGWVDTAHGRLPVPAPAVLKLLQGFPVRFEGPPDEIATPTGAAVLAALAEKDAAPSPLKVISAGYGCGAKRFKAWPNVCRTVLCETPDAYVNERAIKVEADIDDMTPEDASFALERIREAGALDAGVVQRIMKHARPGFTVEALCTDESLESVVRAFFAHTTTIGVRYHEVERVVLPRKTIIVETSVGEVRVKEVRLPDGSVRAKPEHADLRRISERTGVSVQEIRKEVERALGGLRGAE